MSAAICDVEMASTRAGSKGDACNVAYARVEAISTTSKKKSKTIVHPLEVAFPENSVTGVMGPSGSGKTTLLSFLTNSLPSNLKAKGECSFPGVHAFVPQEDHLHGFFTVRGYCAHYMRLSGQKFNESEVDELLADMGLSDQKNTIVGDVFRRGLSGGQKRRLSVGLEALSSPDTLFCDEPTSGLDAESALHVLKFLKAYARNSPGRRVVLTIHQPNSFLWELLDNVVLLSKGHCVYQGPRDDMENFFAQNGAPTPKNFNPADHYVSMVNDDFEFRQKTAEEWEAAFSEWGKRDAKRAETSHAIAKASSQKQLKQKVSSKRAGALVAFFELLRRNGLNLVLNPGILLTRVAMYGMLSGLIGILFSRDSDVMSSSHAIISRVSVLFYIGAFMVFMSIAAMPFFIQERVIMAKEVRNGYYHPSVYHISQAFASLPGLLFLTFVTAVIVCPTLSLANPKWFSLNLFLALCCAEALANLVAILVPHYIIGMALVAACYGFFMLIEGFMLVPSQFPAWIKWIYKVPFHTYSFRVFVYKEFSPITEFPAPANVTYPDGGKSVLELYEISKINPTDDMLVLAGWAVALHLCCIVALTLRFHRK